ncbi:hypothetical protein A2U01_0085103, partial [Trifolium medium]|nr:hypothetical protein [Trifolium medium]
TRSLIQPSLASVQPAALPQLTKPAQLVSPAQPAAPSNLTPSPIQASTPEVFRFMPTPGICLQTMVGSSQHVSREATIEEDVQQTSH